MYVLVRRNPKILPAQYDVRLAADICVQRVLTGVYKMLKQWEFWYIPTAVGVLKQGARWNRSEANQRIPRLSGYCLQFSFKALRIFASDSLNVWQSVWLGSKTQSLDTGPPGISAYENSALSVSEDPAKSLLMYTTKAKYFKDNWAIYKTSLYQLMPVK